jgi:predicted RNA binding protein YcfA (HicA-like mRNA interferase family)
MKRTDLEKHLRSHGCELYREGGKHAIWWNPANRKTSTVPRHKEVNDYTAKGICRALEISVP